MLDVQKLERRWLKYKAKQYLPYAGGSVLAISLIISVVLWDNSGSDASDTNLSAQNAVNVDGKQNPAVPSSPKSEDNVTFLEPSMDFVQSFDNVPQEEPPATPVQAKPFTPAMPAPVPPPKLLSMPEAPTATQVTAPAQPSGATTLTINRNESKLDIEGLQCRFKDNANANLGLFIARYHYDHGDYTEAYNYALKTNAINSKIDESWILFAKSLVKLGKSEEAKKTLRLYISQSNSDSAKGLLDSIEKGNFK